MDTNGKIFKYVKTKYVPLEYHKVASITRLEDGECVLEIPKINYNYKINCRRAYSIYYIGLLNTEYGYIPYEFCEEKKENTRRKI